MAKRLSKAEKLTETRISNMYRAKCQGIQVDIMDIGKIFQVGREAVAKGVDDALLGDIIHNFVQSIRKN
jgi:hypothetical protein